MIAGQFDLSISLWKRRSRMEATPCVLQGMVFYSIFEIKIQTDLFASYMWLCQSYSNLKWFERLTGFLVWFSLNIDTLLTQQIIFGSQSELNRVITDLGQLFHYLTKRFGMKQPTQSMMRVIFIIQELDWLNPSNHPLERTIGTVVNSVLFWVNYLVFTQYQRYV